MLDEELASIIRFVLAAAGNPTPIYHEMPENFVVPAIYFPPPELATDGDTLSTYTVEYTWFVKVLHVRDDTAYAMARDVLTAIMRARRFIPLFGADGKATGKGFRLKDPELKTLDKSGIGGGAQLTLTWGSRRPYADLAAQKMQRYNLDINEAYQSAVAGAQAPTTGQ